jgi:hypothetical protein
VRWFLVDAPALAPDHQQRNQYSDWAKHREQAACELAMPIPRPGVYQEREYRQAGQQLVEQKTLVLPEEAEADGSAQRPQRGKAAGAGHCRNQRTQAAGLVEYTCDAQFMTSICEVVF